MENNFDWQGKRKDQVEYSLKTFGASMALTIGVLIIWLISYLVK